MSRVVANAAFKYRMALAHEHGDQRRRQLCKLHAFRIVHCYFDSFARLTACYCTNSQLLVIAPTFECKASCGVRQTCKLRHRI